MPQPAPKQFDAYDKLTLRTSVLGALGPILALLVLLSGYAMSAHLCQGRALSWLWIAGLIGLGVAACCGALLLLMRAPRRSEAGLSFLVWMGIGVEAFSVCVLLAFALALWTEVRCD